MANALTKPKFRHPLTELGPIDSNEAAVSIEVKIAGTAVGNDTDAALLPLYTLNDDVPWNTGIGTSFASSTKAAEEGERDFRQGLHDSAVSELAAAEAAMTAAQSELEDAIDAWEAAATAARVAGDDYDSARMQRWKALINLNTATRIAKPAPIAAAHARLTAADADKAAALVILEAANAALLAAFDLKETKQAARTLAGSAADTARRIEVVTAFQLALAQVNVDNAPEIGGEAWARYAAGGEFSGEGLGGFDWQPNGFGDDSFGCHVSNTTFRSWSMGIYRVRLVVSDKFYQSAKGNGYIINVEVNEVRKIWAKETDVYHYPPAGEREHQCEDFEYWARYGAMTLTYEDASVSFALDDAVQDDATRNWIMLSESVEVPLPDLGDTNEPADATLLSIQGSPILPTSVIDQIQRCGAERNRQGWAEFTTLDTHPTRRYLTMTASKAPTGPRDKTYSGSLALVPKDVPIVGDPDPLVIHDTLSDDAKAIDAPAPTNSYTVTDEAKIISPLIREVDSPKGLIWTLSHELTSEEILSAVNAIAAQSWADDLPFLVTFDALSLAYPDYAAQQKARFKLKHQANDTREIGDTFTTTHKWRIVKRNADTGVVTLDERETEIEWSVVDGSDLERTDDDWTEIPIPAANEEIRLEVLPGENEDPHTFGAFVPVLALP